MSKLIQPKFAGRTGDAAAKLRELVLNGAFDADERLFEVNLSERLGLSRTPVRAALSTLENEGLLSRAEGSGYVVRSFTVEDVFDAIEIRGVMEGTSLRLAAERGVKQEKLDAIEEILVAFDKVIEVREASEIDVQAYSELNNQFHKVIPTLAGSKTIEIEIKRVNRLPFAAASSFLAKQHQIPGFRESLVRAHRQHRAMISAVQNREGTRVEAIAREHARVARENFMYAYYEDRNLAKLIPGLSLVEEQSEKTT